LGQRWARRSGKEYSGLPSRLPTLARALGEISLGNQDAVFQFNRRTFPHPISDDLGGHSRVFLYRTVEEAGKPAVKSFLHSLALLSAASQLANWLVRTFSKIVISASAPDRLVRCFAFSLGNPGASPLASTAADSSLDFARHTQEPMNNPRLPVLFAIDCEVSG
jgi:hypothetical protein